MFDSLKTYFYFIFRTSTMPNNLQQSVKFFCVVWDVKYICHDLAFRTKDKAIVTILGNGNNRTNHDDISGMFILCRIHRLLYSCNLITHKLSAGI